MLVTIDLSERVVESLGLLSDILGIMLMDLRRINFGEVDDRLMESEDVVEKMYCAARDSMLCERSAKDGGVS